ncbi:MAG: MOSC domain-containing protein [Anaerolineae bacterium]|nr:MAG: MOSC domain-containing protein [Anaerolineae bacterium]
MMEVAAVTAISGKGLVGDASLGRRSRQVLLVDIEILNEEGLDPGDVRENVTLEGLELSGLTPQHELMIGEVLLELTGACEPCSKLDDLRPGLSSDIQGRRGVLARVVRGGELKLGDPVSAAHDESATSAPQGARSI